MKLSAGVDKLVELGKSCVDKLSSAVDENSLKEFTEGSLVTGFVTRLHLFALLFEVSSLYHSIFCLTVFYMPAPLTHCIAVQLMSVTISNDGTCCCLISDGLALYFGFFLS